MKAVRDTPEESQAAEQLPETVEQKLNGIFHFDSLLIASGYNSVFRAYKSQKSSEMILVRDLLLRKAVVIKRPSVKPIQSIFAKDKAGKIYPFSKMVANIAGLPLDQIKLLATFNQKSIMVPNFDPDAFPDSVANKVLTLMEVLMEVLSTGITGEFPKEDK